jgi:hypothetical protein
MFQRQLLREGESRSTDQDIATALGILASKTEVDFDEMFKKQS